MMASILCLVMLACSGCMFVGNVNALASKGDGVSKNNMKTVRLTSTEAKKSSIVLKKGSAIKLECAFQTQSWSYVQWVKLQLSDGFSPKVIQANETYTNGSLQISNVVIEDVLKEDAGNYSCISTSAGGATAFEFHVVVKEMFFCDDNPCSPNGECFELIDSYFCDCHSRFMGKNCQLRDLCWQNPCLNNGSCTSTGNTFNCSCLEGFAGDKCEREICTVATCNDGGSCSESPGGNIQCDCRYDRTGERCQHKCTFSRISNRNRYNCRGKTCIISASGQERCECHSHTHSNYCIMESDVQNECSDPNICNGRGSCRDYTYKYTCQCNSYASGRNCEFFNECNSRQDICGRNGATCVDLPVGYKCTNCPAGQHGDKCQYKPNPCEVTCSQYSMQVNCDLRFLDEKLSSVALYFNSKLCKMDLRSRTSYMNGNSYGYRIASRTVGYDSCGTVFKEENVFLVYSNTVRSGEPSSKNDTSGVITRKTGYFRFDMECRIPPRNTSSRALTDMSLMANETTRLKETASINIPTSIHFCKKNFRESVAEYIVGDRLYVKLETVSLSNPLLKIYGILIPVTCFATADQDGRGPQYVLLQNGCVKDETFRFEKPPPVRYRNSETLKSYFSFDSFSFKDKPGKLYLHCNARMCLNHSSYADETISKNCEMSCIEDEVDREDVAAIATTKIMKTTPNRPTTVSHRNKRSLWFLFPAILGSLQEPSIVDRMPGSVIIPGQGQAAF